jgi:magnesium-transporting ATPase (P-type)
VSKQGLIECAGPNGEIYKFDSRMILAETGQALMTGNQSRGSFSAGSEGSNNYSLKDFPHQQYISLSVNNVILQATHLRNTDWLIGVAVYTGNDTKIGQNKSHPPIKWTQMDRFVNKLVAIVFVFQLLIVIVLGVLGNVWSVYFTSEVRTNRSRLSNPGNLTFFKLALVPRSLLRCDVLVVVDHYSASLRVALVADDSNLAQSLHGLGQVRLRHVHWLGPRVL